MAIRLLVPAQFLTSPFSIMNVWEHAKEAEYIQGHIPGSTNIPLHAIEDVEFIAESKEDPLYVYCHTGVRSRLAVDQLQEMGYRNARNIGGIAAYTGKLAV